MRLEVVHLERGYEVSNHEKIVREVRLYVIFRQGGQGQSLGRGQNKRLEREGG